jgi:hypothetical protein
MNKNKYKALANKKSNFTHFTSNPTWDLDGKLVSGCWIQNVEGWTLLRGELYMCTLSQKVSRRMMWEELGFIYDIFDLDHK